MKIYFTSDTHASHTNLILGTSSWPDKARCRNFSTLNDHDNYIIDKFNSTINPDDTLYHLGDFAFNGLQVFINFRSKIKCKNIHLILGNHDQNIDKELNGVKLNSLFTSVSKYKELYLNKTLFCLFHFPISSWHKMSSNSIHLFGHCHSKPENKFFNGGKSMDVGIDGNNYTPYSLDEIFSIMESRNRKIEGHH